MFCCIFLTVIILKESKRNLILICIVYCYTNYDFPSVVMSFVISFVFFLHAGDNVFFKKRIEIRLTNKGITHFVPKMLISFNSA